VIARAGGDTSPAKFPVLKGPYLGQAPPGLTPQIFAPGIVSTPDLREMSATVSADGREIYFHRQYDTHTKDGDLFGCRMVGDAWTPPERVTESAGYAASMPYLTRNNQRLYVRSPRPAPDADPGVGGMWALNRRGDGWAEPTFVGRGASADGALYVTSYVTDAQPIETYLVKVTERDGRFAGYERLAIQPGFGGQTNPAIAADGSYVVFDYGGSDMHVSFKKRDGTWADAIDLTQHGFGRLASSATISADGKYLFFKQGEPASVSGDSSNRDLYWVDIRVIEKLRPKEDQPDASRVGDADHGPWDVWEIAARQRLMKER
jgi:hypothetical protein